MCIVAAHAKKSLDKLTEQDIKLASNLNPRQENPNFVSTSEEVVNKHLQYAKLVSVSRYNVLISFLRENGRIAVEPVPEYVGITLAADHKDWLDRFTLDASLLDLLKQMNDSELQSIVLEDTENEVIRSFVIRWRLHFLQVMQPQYLPARWSVDNPIHKRPSDDMFDTLRFSSIKV